MKKVVGILTLAMLAWTSYQSEAQVYFLHHEFIGTNCVGQTGSNSCVSRLATCAGGGGGFNGTVLDGSGQSTVTLEEVYVNRSETDQQKVPILSGSYTGSYIGTPKNIRYINNTGCSLNLRTSFSEGYGSNNAGSTLGGYKKIYVNYEYRAYYLTQTRAQSTAKVLVDGNPTVITEELCTSDTVRIQAGAGLANLTGNYTWQIKIDNEVWTNVLTPGIGSLANKSYQDVLNDAQYAYNETSISGKTIQYRVFRDWLSTQASLLETETFTFQVNDGGNGFSLDSSVYCDTRNGKLTISNFQGNDPSGYDVFLTPKSGGGTWDPSIDNLAGEPTSIPYTAGTTLEIPNDLSLAEQPQEGTFKGTYTLVIRANNFDGLSVKECPFNTEVTFNIPSVKPSVTSISASPTSFCEDTNNAINLNVSTNQDGGIITWKNPMGSTVGNAYSEYDFNVTGAGEKTYTLEVKDDFQCTATGTVSVFGLTKPKFITGLTVDKTQLCANGTDQVTLTVAPSDVVSSLNYSTYYTESWKRKIGVGNFVTSSDYGSTGGVTNTFSTTTGGSYTFSYTLQNGTCPSQTRMHTGSPVTFYPTIDDFTADAFDNSSGGNVISGGTVCGNTAYLRASHTRGVTGTWTITSNPGNGASLSTTSANKNNTITVSKSGTYKFSYSTSQGNVSSTGCSDSEEITLTFYLEDTSNPSISGFANSAYCGFQTNKLDISGYTVPLGYNGLNTAQWKIKKPNGTTSALGTGADYTLKNSDFTQYGTYVFSYNINHPHCSSYGYSDTKTVRFDEQVNMNITTADAALCVPYSGGTTFTINHDNAALANTYNRSTATVNWSGATVTPGTTSSTVPLPSTDASYTITRSLSGSACTSSASVDISTTQSPPNLSITDINDVCGNTTTSLTLNHTSLPPSFGTQIWDLENAASGSQPTVTRTGNNARSTANFSAVTVPQGDYKYIWSVENTSSCFDSAHSNTFRYRVVTLPTITENTSAGTIPDQAICGNTSIITVNTGAISGTPILQYRGPSDGSFSNIPDNRNATTGKINLSGLSDIGTHLFRWRINDDEDICVDAYEEIRIRRDTLTQAYAGKDSVTCFASFTREGNNFYNVGSSRASAKWTFLSGLSDAGLSVATPVQNGRTLSQTFTQSGTYAFEYRITANSSTPANSCGSFTSDTIYVTYVNVVADIALIDSITCPSNAVGALPDGALRATLSGGLGTDTTYSWSATSFVASTREISSLAPKSYTVTITDDESGCSDTDSYVLGIPDDFTFNPTVDLVQYNGVGVSCAGAEDGVVNLSTVEGGSGNLEITITGPNGYNTSDNSSPYSLSGLGAGTFLVEVEDRRGCRDTTFVIVSEPSPLVINSFSVSSDYSGFGIDCNGNGNGTLAFDLSGGTINGGDKYDITLFETNAAGNTALNTLSYSDKEAIDSITDLSAAYYRINVEDANGCRKNSALIPEQITEPTLLTVTATVVSDYTGEDISCFGESDAVVEFLGTGGVIASNYNYTLKDGPANVRLGTLTHAITGQETGLAASNNYRIELTDANGCLATDAFIITEPDRLITALTQDTLYNGEDLKCFGDSTGIFLATRTGGTGVFDYTLLRNEVPVFANFNQSGTDTLFSERWSGTYRVRIEDENGCVDTTGTVQLDDPTALASFLDGDASLSLARAGFDIRCHGLFDGALDFRPTGGTGAYEYRWSGPNGYQDSLLQDPAGLEAGFYEVMLTDINGCTLYDSVTLLSPTQLLMTDSTTTSPACVYLPDGTITLNAAGGVTYSDDAYRFSYLPKDSVEKQYYLQAGPVTFFDRDGIFLGVVSDSNACADTVEVSIVDAPALDIIITDTTDISCFGGDDGVLEVMASNGNTIAPYIFRLWNADDALPDTAEQSASNSVTFTDLRANLINATYISVEDANGCQDTTSIMTSQPTQIQLDTAVVTLPTCYQDTTGALTILATGGVGNYTFALDSDSLHYFSTGTDSVLYANLSGDNIYTFWVRDANYVASEEDVCTIKKNFRLDDRPKIELGGVPMDVTCAGGADGGVTLTLRAGGDLDPDNWTYAWYETGGFQVISMQQNLSGVAVGDYTLRVQDGLNCPREATFSINEPAPLQIDFELLGTNCSGGTITGRVEVFVSGGSSNDYEVSVDGGPYAPTAFGQLTLFGLTQGMHTLTARNVGGSACTVETTIEVDNPQLEFTMETVQDPTCAGEATGLLSILPKGVGSFAFSIDGGNTFQDSSRFYTGLNEGTYYVVLKDTVTGCTSMADTVSLVDPAPLVLTTSTTYNASCDQANGAVEVAISGLAPFTSPVWEDADGMAVSPQNLSAGTYFVFVTDAQGCSQVDSVVVATDPDPDWEITLLSPVSCDTSGATLALTATEPGIAPYTFAWQHTLKGDSTLSGLDAGTYSAIVTEARGCTDTVQITLSDTAVLNLNVLANPATCGNSNGSFTLTPMGGHAPYTYLWPAGVTALPTESVASGLTPGTYQIGIQDATGCVVYEWGVINETTGVDSVLVNITPSICDQSNGILTLQSAYSGEPISWAFLDADSTVLTTDSTATGLVSGTYFLRTETQSGCEATFTLQIPDSVLTTPLTIEALAVTPEACESTNGSAQVNVSGGASPYTYSWSNETGLLTAGSDALLNSLAADRYQLEITDALGCSLDSVFTIQQTDAPSMIAPTVIEAACGQLGRAIGEAEGGTAPYEFTWSSGEMNDTAVALEAGTASVFVTDAYGCTSEELFFSVSGGPGVQLAEDVITPASCAGTTDGTSSVRVLGGTAPYSFLWADGQSGDQAVGLAAGPHQVVVTDAAGCQDSLTLTVPQQTLQINLLAATAPSCFGDSDGRLIVRATGGGEPSYTWGALGTGSVLTNIASGDYTVTVNDSTGCTVDSIFTVPEADPIALSWSEITDPTCFGGADGRLKVSASGGVEGFSFDWSNGQVGPLAAGLDSGIYTVAVTDANGCLATLTDTLQNPAAIQLISFSEVQPSCHGVADGGFQLSLDHGTTPYLISYRQGGALVTSGQMSAGRYALAIEDVRGCSLLDTLMLGEPEPMVIDSVVITDPTCPTGADGTAQVFASGGVGGFSYQWSNGDTSPFLANLGEQTLSVTVRDSNACQVDFTGLTLVAPEALSLEVLVKEDPSCYGGTDGALSVAPSGGTAPYTIIWEDGTTTFSLSDLVQGTYSASLTDANGCSETFSFTLGQPDSLWASYTYTHPLCADAGDGTILVTPEDGTGTLQVRWDDGAVGKSREGLPEGEYPYWVIDANNCRYDDTVYLTDPEPVSVVLIDSIAPGCDGDIDGMLEVTASGGTESYRFAWDIGSRSSIISNLGAGDYTVTVEDDNGCTASLTTPLTTYEPLTFTTYSVDPACFNEATGELEVFPAGGAGGYFMDWSGRPDTILLLENILHGTYSGVLFDTANCGTEVTETLLNPDEIKYSDDPLISDPNCHGDCDGAISIQIEGGTGAKLVTWSDGQVGSMASGLCEEPIYLEVQDALDCSFKDTLYVEAPDPLVITSISKRDESCTENDGRAQVFVSGGTFPYTYLWSHGDTTASVEGLSAGIYSVTVIDDKGCIIDTTVTIGAPEPLVIDSVQLTEPSCFGSFTGSINVFTSGGEGPVLAKWSNGATTLNVTLLAAGVYSVDLESGGCVADTTLELGQPTELAASIVTQDLPCFGDCAGVIQVSPTGGMAPRTVMWENNLVGRTLTGLCAGTYSGVVIDANGCELPIQANVNQPDTMGVTVVSVLDPICPGTPTGALGVEGFGGTAPYRYSWDNGQTGRTLDGVESGTYTVTVSDQEGCQQSIELELTPPLSQTITSVPESIEVCVGTSVAVDAGEWLAYQWSGPSGFVSTQRLVEIDQPGTYSVMATTNEGCFISESVDLLQVPLNMSVGTIMPTEAFVGDTIVLVDVTDPIPDSVKWTLPSVGMQRLEDGDFYQQIRFLDEGQYPIRMDAYLSGCQASAIDTIQVLAASGRPSNTQSGSGGQAPVGIVDYAAYPNPNAGAFDLALRMTTPDAVTISVFDGVRYQNVWETTLSGGLSYRVPIRIPNSMPSGLYFVRIATETDVESFTIVVER
ncbi:MAG TPA: hypothetical protein DCR93_26060 [Cytophagales bacterium]|nr:hypothetical protein [Cytophagales bacterium]HAP62812.1 hypothetical protein [Cytophagales bacterium]